MEYNHRKFLASFSALLAKMSLADNHINKSERDKISTVWDSLGLTQEQKDYCLVVFNAAQNDGVHIHKYVDEFVSTRFGMEARNFLYYLLWEIACADGILHAKEKEILKWLPSRFGLSVELYGIYYDGFIKVRKIAVDSEQEEDGAKSQKREYSRFQDENKYSRFNKDLQMCVEEACAVIGCSIFDGNEALANAYRKAAMRWHPDRLQMEGVPEELIKKTNENMALINIAWDIIKKHKGTK